MGDLVNRSEILRERTQRSFGYQWTVFGQMADQFREDFLNYIYPVSAEFFAGKHGLDAGCGVGFRALLPLLRPGGAVFIWVYSKARLVTNTIL